MTYSASIDPTWYHALTLSERIAAFRCCPTVAPSPPNSDLATRRLKRWQAQTPFNSGTYFDDRLAQLGIAADTLHRLLGEPIEQIGSRLADSPDWMQQVSAAYSGPAQEPLLLPSGLCTPEQRAFLHIAEPLITTSRIRLRADIAALAEQHPDVPLPVEQIETILFSRLPTQLLALLCRTLILELHVARLQGLLTGETTTERFQHFGALLRRREIALDLLKQYPLLARQLVCCIQQWAACSLEWVQHLCADWQMLCATFSPERAPGALTALRSAGDQHHGGRAVLIAHFEHGLRLVYKPISLATGVHFQELLAWINGAGVTPPFRTLQMLDRGDHGWVEWVGAHDCTAPEQITRFYQRQGGYLALLYALEATDFHAENVIAAGEDPLLIDLETLFHPRLATDSAIAAPEERDLPIHSVLRVGLLPSRTCDVDLSGLGPASGQLTPGAVPVLEARATDTMHVARKRVALPLTQNQPTLDGTAADVRDYSAALVAGFSAMYRLLIARREALLAADGPIAQFAQDRIRVILRDTQTYATLIDESAHPDLLRTALDRDRFFDKLWIAVTAQPVLKRVIEAERADLEQRNIPCFNSAVDSRDAWSSHGQPLGTLFASSGLSQVRQRIARLDDADLTRQCRIIRAALRSQTDEQR